MGGGFSGPAADPKPQETLETAHEAMPLEESLETANEMMLLEDEDGTWHTLPRLSLAVATLNRRVFETLLETAAVDINTPSSGDDGERGWTALHYAAGVDNDDAVFLDSLLAHPAVDVNSGLPDGVRPLHIAAMHNSVRAAGALLERPDLDVLARWVVTDLGITLTSEGCAARCRNTVLADLLRSGGRAGRIDWAVRVKAVWRRVDRDFRRRPIPPAATGLLGAGALVFSQRLPEDLVGDILLFACGVPDCAAVPYREESAVLVQMGFANVARNLGALADCRGDIGAAAYALATTWTARAMGEAEGASGLF